MTEYESLREAAQGLRVTPPRSAWKRLEARLETQVVRRNVRLIQFFGYAAAVLLLVVCCTAALYYVFKPHYQPADVYSQSIEDLAIQDFGESTIYDQQKIHDLLAYQPFPTQR